MEKNQNDKTNQSPRNPSEQSGNKSHQEQTQDGKKKTEIDPNNPVANKYPGSQQDKQKHQDSTSNQGKSNMNVQDSEESEDETIDEVPSARKTPDSEQNKGKNQKF